jgi:regulator of replication initiation timing
MAARFDDAIKQQHVDAKPAYAAKRRHSAELRKLREEMYRMKKAHDDAVTENTMLKLEKEADAKTIDRMAQRLEHSEEVKDGLRREVESEKQSTADSHHLGGGYVLERLHQLIALQRARLQHDSD